MSNPNYINDNGTWKNTTNLYVKNNGSWVEADEGWKNVSGTWTKFYDKYTAATTTTTLAPTTTTTAAPDTYYMGVTCWSDTALILKSPGSLGWGGADKTGVVVKTDGGHCLTLNGTGGTDGSSWSGSGYTIATTHANCSDCLYPVTTTTTTTTTTTEDPGGPGGGPTTTTTEEPVGDP